MEVSVAMCCSEGMPLVSVGHEGMSSFSSHDGFGDPDNNPRQTWAVANVST